MDHIALQLEDIRKPGKRESKDPKIRIFLILLTKPNRKVGCKGRMSYQIVDEIKIAGLQNYDVYEKLNLI